jgi:hypothetical protein
VNSIFSVTSAATETSLLTIAELRAAAGVTGNAGDTRLLTLGRQASAAIARQCGVAADGVNPVTLLSETCSELFRLSGEKACLRLSRRPVTAVASVLIGDEALTTDDYEIDKPSGILRRLSGDQYASWACGKVTVAYTGGVAAVEPDLKLAASKLVTALNAETARDPNLKRVNIPGVMEKEYWVAPSDDPVLSAEIRDLIAPYKQWW